METPKPRRLLLVTQHFWPENFRVNDLAAGFIEDGIEVDVLCGLPNYPAGEWFSGYRYTGPRRQQHHGAEIFRSGEIRRKNNTSLRIFLNYCSFPVYALFNLPRLAGRRYNAVLCYNTSPVMMSLPAIVYAKLHGVPLTTYVLDLWPDNLYSVLPVQNTLLRKVASGVSRWFYRRATRLLAMSPAQAERLQKEVYTGKKDPPIAVVPQHAEDFYATDIYDEALAQRFSGHFNILFAGNLSPAQDLENLVEAMALVQQQKSGSDIRVLVLGDGMSREALEKLIAERGLSNVFTFCGSVPPKDVPRWTGIADALFAGLAKSENLDLTVPAKIPAYFAAAKPMLVAMEGEGALAATASGAALVSEPGNAAALAGNILALRAMPGEERAVLGKAGRACYEKNYRRSILIRRIEDFIF